MASAPHTAAIPLRLQRFLRGPRRLLVVAALLGGLVVGGFLVLGGGGSSKPGVLEGPSADPFTLAYPSTWRALSKDELDLLPGTPLAALRRKDRSALMVIRREKGRAGGDLNKFATTLARELKKRIRDFKGSSAKLVPTRSGKAFYMSYVRTKKGTVHALVIVPAGRRTFTLDSGTRAGGVDAAREIGRIVRSFHAG